MRFSFDRCVLTVAHRNHRNQSGLRARLCSFHIAVTLSKRERFHFSCREASFFFSAVCLLLNLESDCEPEALKRMTFSVGQRQFWSSVSSGKGRSHDWDLPTLCPTQCSFVLLPAPTDVWAQGLHGAMRSAFLFFILQTHLARAPGH